MKTYIYSTTTEVPAEKLYRAIADINRWPEWDSEIEATSHDGRLIPGALFTLKPKGGPRVSMEIVEATAPTRFADLSHLPLAKMRTSHSFIQVAERTRVDVKIEVWGILGLLWDRVVARKQAAGVADQTHAFLLFAARAS
jgi:hypothetical protein